MWSKGEMLIKSDTQKFNCILWFNDTVVQCKMKILLLRNRNATSHATSKRLTTNESSAICMHNAAYALSCVEGGKLFQVLLNCVFNQWMKLNNV